MEFIPAFAFAPNVIPASTILPCPRKPQKFCEYLKNQLILWYFVLVHHSSLVDNLALAILQVYYPQFILLYIHSYE